MLDYKPTLVEKLETLNLPVYYELFVDSSSAIPCITYQEINDYSTAEGDTLRYSQKRFRIKLWGDTFAALVPVIDELDPLMKTIGLTRSNYNELSYNGQLCLIFDYQGLAQEEINLEV